MKKFLILVILLSGCASFEKAAKSPDTFAICKAADIGSTAYALRTGRFEEKNPVVANSLQHGYFPLIALSVAIYYGLQYVKNDTLTMGANALTCGVAAHNINLILKGN